MLLKEETANDPHRFARLALRLTNEAHPSYGTAILMGFAEGSAAVDPEPVFQAIRHIADLRDTEHDRWIGPSLAQYNDTAPIDLVERVLDRALNATNPANDQSRFTSSSGRSAAEQLHMTGMNSARGANVLSLGDLLISDADGSRTQLVVPYFGQLAADPILAVRSCTAHLLAAAFRHARTQAVAAFWKLIEPRSQPAGSPSRDRILLLRMLERSLRVATDLARRVFTSGSQPHADDLLLTGKYVQQVLTFIGNDNAPLVRPVIDRMLASETPEVRKAGGRMSTFAGLEWGCTALLAKATKRIEPDIRVGVAEMASARMRFTAGRGAAAAMLEQLFSDPVHQVRQAASSVAVHLRGAPLRPFNEVISSLIASESYTDAVPQLFITLQRAPDRVDDLVLGAAQRFMESLGDAVADLSTSAAADVHYVTELVLRGLAQTDDSARRSALLDIVDSMVRFGAYGIEEAIEQSAR
jgi:hypothetical protein